MAKPKKERAVTEAQVKAYNQEKFKANKKWIIPLFLIAVFIFVFIFYQIGKYQISNYGQSNVREFPEKFITGVNYSYDFAPDLVLLLPSESTGPYTFSIGSGVLPKGLDLNTNGVMVGKPEGKGSTFEICIKDVDENSACETYLINTNYEENSINNNLVDNSIIKTASVTIDNASCIITDNGYIDIPKTMCQVGGPYAKEYEITVSGSMTGPEEADLFIWTEPTVGSGGNPGELSCGGWEEFQQRTCTRQDNSSIETAQWSYTTGGYGELVNVNPNMQVVVNVRIAYSDTHSFKTQNVNATYTVSCPKVDYCSMVKA